MILITDESFRDEFVDFFRSHSINVFAVRNDEQEDYIISDVNDCNSRMVMSVNYNRLPPVRLFEIAGFEWINLHFGLLPEYCGAYPLHRSMMNGDTELSIILHSIDVESKNIGIIDRDTTPILFNDSGFTLVTRAKRIGLQLIEKNFSSLLGKGQNVSQSYAYETKLWNRDYSDIRTVNWNRTAFDIHNQVRAFTKPYKGVKCFINGMTAIIWKSQIANPFSADVPPGTVLSVDYGRAIEVATGSGVLRMVDYDMKTDVEINQGDCFMAESDLMQGQLSRI